MKFKIFGIPVSWIIGGVVLFLFKDEIKPLVTKAKEFVGNLTKKKAA